MSLKMQLDVEVSPPANVWILTFQGSTSPLGKLIDMSSLSQVSNFPTRGTSVAEF